MSLFKVDFGSRGHNRVPDFYSAFVKKSTLSRVNPTVTRLHLGGRDLTPSDSLNRNGQMKKWKVLSEAWGIPKICCVATFVNDMDLPQQ